MPWRCSLGAAFCFSVIGCLQQQCLRTPATVMHSRVKRRALPSDEVLLHGMIIIAVGCTQSAASVAVQQGLRGFCVWLPVVAVVACLCKPYGA